MLAVGQRVGRYEVESLLGEGGMGEVYAARDTQLGRRVALKVLHAGAAEGSRARLLREARIAATFEHAGAAVVYEVGETEGTPFIAMELVRGERLGVAARLLPIPKRARPPADEGRPTSPSRYASASRGG